MADLSSILLGAAIGAIGTYWLEKLRRQNALTDVRRTAYASWFTNEALVRSRIERVCERLLGFPKDRERHRALIEEVQGLAEIGRDLLSSTNAVILVEKRRQIRNQLGVLANFLGKMIDSLEFAGRHYTENLEFHDHIANFSAEFASINEAELSEDVLTELSKTRAAFHDFKTRFEAHDQTCPFKSPDFKSKLDEAMKLVERQTDYLRESLATALSK